jgi:hypothetical protein
VKSKWTVTASWLATVALVVAGVFFLAGGSQATRPAVAAGGSITAPSQAGWSSGWVQIDKGETIPFSHNLGGDPSTYAVQLWFWDTGLHNLGVNTYTYGGMMDNDVLYGAHWRNLDNSSIQVHRNSGDTVADLIRVWVWVPQETEQWCSPWTHIDPGDDETFDHNLGGDMDDYTVGLWFMDTNGPNGVNQRGYGGLAVAEDRYGAWWHNLTTSSVSVRRAGNDPYADSARICVSVPSQPPDFDSDWQEIDPDEELVLDHDLGGDPNSYIVRMEFKHTAPGGIGIHQEYAGGNTPDDNYLGANWEHLTNEQITVYREPDDGHVNQVRVRIWVRQVTHNSYLPMVERNK